MNQRNSGQTAGAIIAAFVIAAGLLGLGFAAWAFVEMLR